MIALKVLYTEVTEICPMDPKDNPAADLIRQKLSSIYAEEPDAKKEVEEVLGDTTPLSKHQQFMYDLHASGKPLAEVQTAWHDYYTALPDTEKHEVWREFYAANEHTSKLSAKPVTPVIEDKQEATLPAPITAHFPIESTPPRQHKASRKTDVRSVADIKRSILKNVSTTKRIKAKRHFQSLVFGLGMGSVVVLILLFSFFNERFIAPFITPSKHVSATPIIIDPNSTAIDPQPKVIIPKINVEIPVVYDEPSIADSAVENALERGVLHYATTPDPGQHGNVVLFGHSSNNIFNHGQYKFAFVLLSRLENGDLFYLTKDGKRYTYQVYEKRIVKPTDVSVMGPADKPDTATLITCDPPGTSLNRLVVTGVQIDPDPATNGASTAPTSTAQPKIVPSNAPSLWQRFTHWLGN